MATYRRGVIISEQEGIADLATAASKADVYLAATRKLHYFDQRITLSLNINFMIPPDNSFVV
jgi:hypothetical protein